MKYKDDILYSMKQCNYQKFKSKPFGWKYGVNKSVKIRGEERVRQYACDFYGNKRINKNYNLKISIHLFFTWGAFIFHLSL